MEPMGSMPQTLRYRRLMLLPALTALKYPTYLLSFLSTSCPRVSQCQPETLAITTAILSLVSYS